MEEEKRKVMLVGNWTDEDKQALLRKDIAAHLKKEVDEIASREIARKMAELEPAIIKAVKSGKEDIKIEELIQVSIYVKPLEPESREHKNILIFSPEELNKKI